MIRHWPPKQAIRYTDPLTKFWNVTSLPSTRLWKNCGKYPTYHLCDKEFLRWLKPSAIVINSSRGAVVDNYDLEEALRTEHIRAAVLDVWENEPTPNPELLRLAAIATPHIAGYSFDGKVNGTTQVYEALCASVGSADGMVSTGPFCRRHPSRKSP
jgi:phosphoglycerate dehydrogenase-like enzyme